MKKYWFVLIMVLYCSFSASAQRLIIGDSASLSLITCSPGPEVYAKFGHTAIRLVDPSKRMDIVFNYGIFNFDTPNFYLKFIKGETDYQIGAYDTFYFLPEYKERNSQVTEQVLNLTKEEKQRLVDALYLNLQPENKIYRYNFIFDNCATRPRDKILEVINEKLEYKSDVEQKSFREWIGVYTGENSWVKFGIDLLLGKDADALASRWFAMFLPEILCREFGSVELSSNDGTKRPLVSSTKILISKTADETKKTGLFDKPVTVTLVVLFIAVIFFIFEKKRKKYYKIIDSFLLIVTGLVGVLIFYLMFFSVHPLVKSNFNILWCNPLNIFVGIFLWSKKMRSIINYFQIANVMLFLGALIIWVLSVQSINLASVPLIILLLIRSIYWVVKKSGKRHAVRTKY